MKKICCCFNKKTFFKSCGCVKRYFMQLEEDDEGIYSEDFSSGDSEKEEDMINYIDERK